MTLQRYLYCKLCRLLDDERGQDMIEYALMVGFVVVIGAASFPQIAGKIGLIFSKMDSLLTQASNS